MGAITPIATGLSSIAGTLGTVNQIVSTAQALGGNSNAEREQELALRQLQARQNLAASQSAAGATLDRQTLAANAASAEEDRKRALRRAVARQRASFGGQGINTNNGSAQAILLGLFDESEEELNQRTRLDTIRSASIDQDLSNQSSLNVLQRTQLQERQKLNDNITGFDDLF